MQDSDRSRRAHAESPGAKDRPIDASPASPRRRALLVGVGGALTAGLAGCSGDGEGGTPTDAAGGPDDDGTTDDGETPTATDAPATDETTPSATPTEAGPTKEPMGSVRRNDVDELEIVGYQSSTNLDIFSVDIVVHNTGEEPTDLEAYTWDLCPLQRERPGRRGLGGGSGARPGRPARSTGRGVDGLLRDPLRRGRRRRLLRALSHLRGLGRGRRLLSGVRRFRSATITATPPRRSRRLRPRRHHPRQRRPRRRR